MLDAPAVNIPADCEYEPMLSAPPLELNVAKRDARVKLPETIKELPEPMVMVPV